MDKRRFMQAALGVGAGLLLAGRAGAQSESVVNTRRARTTVLFRPPEGNPNALAGSLEGLWVGEQKWIDAAEKSEKAMLLDWNSGKLLRTVVTNSRNTSGMAYGGGYIWMGANAPPFGFFQVDMDSRTHSHRQIPLGTYMNGGGTHGALYHEGKLWIVANRLNGILRVDPVTWEPEYMIPFQFPRWHDIAWDDGAIWLVTGTDSVIERSRPGLAKFDAATGRLLETVAFEPGSADPHGLEIHNGVFYICDAGVGPGLTPAGEYTPFTQTSSPTARTICRVDFI